MVKVDYDAAHGGPASGAASRVSRCTPAAPDDAVVIVDDNGMITSWNSAAEKLFGYPADAAIGKSLALIIPPKHQLRHAAGFHKAIGAARLANGGRPARVTATTADGRLVPVTMRLGLWGLSTHGALGVVAVLRRAGYSASFV
jgi:PAS domain S-box-containing protein